MKLTPTPTGNDFLNKEELEFDEIKYPLDLYFCETCHHVQLGHVVDPKILYQKNYTYLVVLQAGARSTEAFPLLLGICEEALVQARGLAEVVHDGAGPGVVG